MPENVRQKMSNSLKGRISPKKRKITQYNKDMNEINKYESIKLASIETGILYTSISNCLANRSKSAGGFIWL